MGRFKPSYAMVIWLLAGLLVLNAALTFTNMRQIAIVDVERDHAVERLRELRSLRHGLYQEIEPRMGQSTSETQRDRFVSWIDERIAAEPPDAIAVQGLRQAREIMRGAVGREWSEVVREVSVPLDKVYQSDKVEVDNFRDAAQRLGLKDSHFLLVTELFAVLGLIMAGWLVRRELLRRDRVEHKLIASRARLSEAEKLAKLGYWERDLRTGRIGWSRELCSIFGLSLEDTTHIETHPEEDGGLSLYLARIHPEDRARVREAIERACATGEPYSETYRLGTDGAPRIIFEQGRVLKGADGAHTRLFVTAQDVTALDEAQRAIRASEARFRALCNSADVAIVESGPDGAARYLSPRWSQITGYSSEETIGFAWTSMMHPEDKEDVVASWMEATSKGKSWSHEHRIVCRDGAVKWVRVLATSIRDAEERIVGYISTVEDVTDVHEHERRERDSRARFEAVIKSSSQLLYEWDAGANTVSVEDNSFEVVGIKPEELSTIGGWIDRVHPDDREAFKAELDRVVRMREPFNLEYRLRRDDGTYVSVQDRGYFVDSVNHSTQMVGLVSDLTARKRLEAELLQAQKVESIGRLAGGIAHDFNNWLTVILGHLALARESADDPVGVRHGLDQIEAAAESSAQLTRQLVAFARQQVIEPQICSINELAERSAKLLGRLLGDDIELAIHPAPDLWPVRIDPSQFEQVLLNLTVNARDAMPQGGRLTIETRNATLDEAYVAEHLDATPGDYVCLTVTDSGMGIPQEIIPKLFEPFFTTKELGKGTGMGLPTCLGIVKQSGGHIYVYSEVGRGTTFKVYLPRVSGTPAPRRNVSTPTTSRGGTETVLVVEDQPMIRELIERILSEAGYRLLVAKDATEAQHLVATRGVKVDILVTDVVLPGMSGPELAATLRSTNPTLRVLFCSGYTDHTAGLEPTGNFLQKPYSPTALLQRVRELLDAPAKVGSGT